MGNLRLLYYIVLYCIVLYCIVETDVGYELLDIKQFDVTVLDIEY